MKVLVADPIHNAGVELLRAQPDLEVTVQTGMSPAELLEAIGDVDGLVVRSETKVTADVLAAAERLQVVGRAGVGVDNIDLDTATLRGVAVVNAPTGNTVAAAEHTIAVLFSLARKIPQADASLKRGEWTRGAFMGVEIQGKTLGVIGLGRVGSEVVRRARGLDMHVLGYDPFVAAERAGRIGAELASLQDLLAKSDFVTIHTPLTDASKSLLGPRELALLRPGTYIINVARGGLVDEEELLRALDEGRVAGAALDVFSQEPPADYRLAQHPKVVGTPHLGASTVEAQAGVATEVAEQVLAVLRGNAASNTVNAPFVAPETHAVIAPYLGVAVDLGKIAIQLAEEQLTGISLQYQGEIADGDTGPLKAAALIGLLQPVTDERVNLVNASLLAKQRGLEVREDRDPTPAEHVNQITVSLAARGGAVVASGAHARGRTHILRVNDYFMDTTVDSPYLLFVENRDQPGIIGAVGTIAGEHDINISFMDAGRLAPRGQAMMVVGMDEPVPDAALARFRAIPGVVSARLVRM